MIVSIDKAPLTESERFAAVFHHDWIALDMDSGAYLIRSRGHGRYGLPTYRLLLHYETPEERGGVLGEFKHFASFERSVIRCWSDDEAIEIANQRLPRLIKRRDKYAAEVKQ